MEKITLELVVGNVGRRLRSAPVAADNITTDNGQRFSFELWRKQCPMGDVPLDQFWIEIQSIYGQRKRIARNFQSIVDFYVAKCIEQEALFDPETQGTDHHP